jgi:DNA-binding CsgD family transcriptional regulator
LGEAHAALARADWEAARSLYRAALELDPSAEALDGLGQALWWVGETDEAVELRSRAFAAFRRRGDVDRAGYLASYLAAEYRIAGNASLGKGWLGRAERLLAGAPECSAHGWLHIELSKRAPDPPEEERHAREAAEIARRLANPDLEVAALSHVGLALISGGRVEDGLSYLDEAMAAATGGEARDPLAIGEACCITLVACEQLADVQRARDWGEAVVQFTRRRNYTPLAAWCRSVYASFLIATGLWEEAQRELDRSLREYRRLGSSRPLAAIAALADLRIRQGRLEEAERLLEGLEDRPGALGPVVRLQLARGQTDVCRERVDQRLEALAGDDGHSAPVVALRVAVRLACGDVAGARDANARLAEAAERLGRRDLVAMAKIYAARANRLEAVQPPPSELEGAIEELARLGLPLEEGEARVELARALASERPRLAIEQARVARAAFERLGAARHADEAAGLLRELGAPGRPAPRAGGGLTRRERQVLELLAAGLSNAQIAERLVISPKTAEHHVGGILRKLDLRSRAEAAAYAVRAQAAERSPDGGML